MTMTPTPTLPPGETKAERVRATTSMLDPAIMRRAIGRQLRQAQPAPPDEEPRDVRRRGRQRADDDPVLHQPLVGRPEPERVRCARGRVPLVHRALRELRGGGRRGEGQGAGRHAAQDAVRDDGQPPSPRRLLGGGPGHAARPRRRGGRRRRRGHPERRRRDRRDRQHRRVGDHRRIGTGHPRGGRRPLGRHRRHPCALRPDRGAHQRPSGRDVHRPDDRPGRGLRAPEDAERDRVEHPARRPDDHLPARDRQPAAVLGLLARRAVGRGPGRAPGLPDPDDDRRAALRDRHRGHGPAGPAQRPRDERPRGRGRGRREHAAARQDRDDHLRCPPGRRVPAGPGGGRARPRRRGAPVEPGRRDPRRSFDPRPRR